MPNGSLFQWEWMDPRAWTEFIRVGSGETFMTQMREMTLSCTVSLLKPCWLHHHLCVSQERTVSKMERLALGGFESAVELSLPATVQHGLGMSTECSALKQQGVITQIVQNLTDFFNNEVKYNIMLTWDRASRPPERCTEGGQAKRTLFFKRTLDNLVPTTERATNFICQVNFRRIFTLRLVCIEKSCWQIICIFVLLIWVRRNDRLNGTYWWDKWRLTDKLNATHLIEITYGLCCLSIQTHKQQDRKHGTKREAMLHVWAQVDMTKMNNSELACYMCLLVEN